MTAIIELTEQERASLAEKAPSCGASSLRSARRWQTSVSRLTPDGKCPASPCPCDAKGDDVEARARELLDDLAAEPCHDCFVILPVDATCFAIDGAIVCGPCGQRRYGARAAEY